MNANKDTSGALSPCCLDAHGAEDDCPVFDAKTGHECCYDEHHQSEPCRYKAEAELRKAGCLREYGPDDFGRIGGRTEATYEELRQPVADLVAKINGLGPREQEIVIAAVMSSVRGQKPVTEALLFAEIERLRSDNKRLQRCLGAAVDTMDGKFNRGPI